MLNTSYEEALEQWEQLDIDNDGDNDKALPASSNHGHPPLPRITCAEYFQSKSKTLPTAEAQQRCGRKHILTNAFLRCCCCQKPMTPESIKSKQQLIALATAPLSEDNGEITRLYQQYTLRSSDLMSLQELVLIGNSLDSKAITLLSLIPYVCDDPSPQGGMDPLTDLRGVGQFGLIQLLHFVTEEALQENVEKIYRMSRDPKQEFPGGLTMLMFPQPSSGRCSVINQFAFQEFPLSVVSLNLSKTVLQQLKSGALDKHIVSESGDALGCVNLFHAGGYMMFYEIWFNGSKTIADAGFVLKDLEAEMKKYPERFIQACKAKSSQNTNKVTKTDSVEFSKF